MLPSLSQLEHSKTESSTLRDALTTTLLNKLDWFVAYREALADHMERGAPLPTYDMSRFAEVERRVDALIRKRRYVALKDTLMMALLSELDWFVAYREALVAHRERGKPMPAYDKARFESVERHVDELIRKVIDPTYTR